MWPLPRIILIADFMLMMKMAGHHNECELLSFYFWNEKKISLITMFFNYDLCYFAVAVYLFICNVCTEMWIFGRKKKSSKLKWKLLLSERKFRTRCVCVCFVFSLSLIHIYCSLRSEEQQDIFWVSLRRWWKLSPKFFDKLKRKIYEFLN